MADTKIISIPGSPYKYGDPGGSSYTMTGSPFPTGAAATTIFTSPYVAQQTSKQTTAEAIKAANWSSAGAYSQFFEAVASKDSNNQYDLQPVGGSKSYDVDIVKNFNWTKSTYRDEVPRVKLRELKITGLQQIKYYWNLINQGNPVSNSEITDFVGGLYDTESTNFHYIFPYYSSNILGSSSSWSEKVPVDADYITPAGPIANAAASVLKGAARVGLNIGSVAFPNAAPALQKIDSFVSKLNVSLDSRRVTSQFDKAVNIGAKAYGMATGSPYAGIEQPMYFSGGDKQTFTISFPLFNTTSIEDIRRNYDFIRLFQFQNLLKRTSVATYQPPVIYKTMSDAEHASPVSMNFFYVSKFNVDALGPLRSIDLQNGSSLKISIPEAYLITINFSALITSSQNIFSSVMSNNGKSVVQSMLLAQNTNNSNRPSLFNVV
jgi:hypothetical protein